MWDLDANYPMVAANYADKRRELALSIGLGRKPGAKAPSRKKAAGDEQAENLASSA
jgi:predicted transcriptional regulator